MYVDKNNVIKTYMSYGGQGDYWDNVVRPVSYVVPVDAHLGGMHLIPTPETDQRVALCALALLRARASWSSTINFTI
jgi:NADH:ubiquinone oxidoreductase subunit B-like Fe-S oxidoreductase